MGWNARGKYGADIGVGTRQAVSAQYQSEILQLIEQRDHWEEKATELAQAVGEHFGFDVGEHSSANCPVQNAVDHLDEVEASRAQGAEPVAWNDRAVAPVVSKLYRKFKEWSQRGFTADDVTWCEVRGYVAELLNTHPPTATQVPEGWELVPVEPTPEMREAFHEAHEECENPEGVIGPGSPDHQWRAMLAVAPKPPAEKAGGDQ